MTREHRYYNGSGPVTPWGQADSREIYSGDVSFYGTPSHGGFRVAGKSLERIPDKYHGVSGYPAGWFEEDCDWAIVAFFLPELFTTDEAKAADSTLDNWHPDVKALRW